MLRWSVAAAIALSVGGRSESGTARLDHTSDHYPGSSRVAARDAKGLPVNGLKENDFQILDNGQPQSIAVFHPGRLADEAVAPALPPGAFTNRLPANPSPRSGYSIILVDWPNSGFSRAVWARQRAAEMVNRLNPAEQVGLYSLDLFRLKVVNEIGSSKAAMLDSLKTLTGMNSLPVTALSVSLDPLVRGTLSAFEAIAGHLAGLPGRKALIWVVPIFRCSIRADPSIPTSTWTLRRSRVPSES